MFACPENPTFTGITVIVVGDFPHLQPVRAKTVYAEYRNI